MLAEATFIGQTLTSAGLIWLLREGRRERQHLVNLIAARNPGEFATLQRASKTPESSRYPVPVEEAEADDRRKPKPTKQPYGLGG